MPDWKVKTALQLPAFVDRRLVEAFTACQERDVAGFCLDMYRRMGLLEGIRVERSGDPDFRAAACEISDFFVDVPYQGEIGAGARHVGGELKLHEGGDAYLTLPPISFDKKQISPTRDARLRWMQSLIHCTHYVSGAGEQLYMKKDDAPEIAYVNRDTIDRPNEAYTELA